MTGEGRALGKFRGLSLAVADVDKRMGVVVGYRDRLIEQRDHDASRIPLSEREVRMWENRIARANKAVSDLEEERSRLMAG